MRRAVVLLVGAVSLVVVGRPLGALSVAAWPRGAVVAPSPLAGTITGSGSTFADRFYKAAAVGFARTSPQVKVEYRAIGSGRGKSEFGRGTMVVAFARYLLSDGQDVAVRGDYARLPDEFRRRALAALDSITVNP